ncbi:MAG: hypothetical protein NZ583_09050, partial [Desulfobacterota bacterium]|nr:hypothetical protein [Thermodesulfobacteriota bacterium]
YGVISASLHDCGMFKVKELNEAHRFTVRGPMPHEEQGYHLLSSFSTLFRCAEIVRYHHMWFNGHDDYGVGKEDVPLQSYVIHLSDRIDVLCRRNVPILVQQDISMMWGNWPYQQRFWKNRGHLQNLKCRS